MDNIDYEALAQADHAARYGRYVDWGDGNEVWKDGHRRAARAVVAAYQEQQRAKGMVVLRRADVLSLLDTYTNDPDGMLVRLEALAATGNANG